MQNVQLEMNFHIILFWSTYGQHMLPKYSNKPPQVYVKYGYFQSDPVGGWQTLFC